MRQNAGGVWTMGAEDGLSRKLPKMEKCGDFFVEKEWVYLSPHGDAQNLSATCQQIQFCFTFLHGLP